MSSLSLLQERDELYMDQALQLAREAGDRGEIPIGAVISSPYGELIGRGSNRVEELKSQRYHAETEAIAQAGIVNQDWRLNGSTLYVTLEPCMMCISLCALSRIERVVYGADSPLFGFRLDTEGVLTLYTNQIKNITGGVCAQQAAAMLHSFFASKRREHHD